MLSCPAHNIRAILLCLAVVQARILPCVHNFNQIQFEQITINSYYCKVPNIFQLIQLVPKSPAGSSQI
ncbi:hypothetical protein PGT21_031955 [Puccinia graminis f. sp. tritici]|uniref:Secreted protein n=1 Tax=Puccinia graminis f. sp. tritici TaxID=56615 RepID=A0A5B0QCJ0_PUCGR|nr:hypothetical protein PGT21_031955 [Puccinia graminis f. sp. tritici]KAA1139142.1 hypothetical protein PGTUg99_036578 [Puccinia graminis f. sp. tritici]